MNTKVGPKNVRFRQVSLYVIFFFFITDVDVNMLEEEEDVPEVTM
jgi:hypothetical protein